VSEIMEKEFEYRTGYMDEKSPLNILDQASGE